MTKKTAKTIGALISVSACVMALMVACSSPYSNLAEDSKDNESGPTDLQSVSAALSALSTASFDFAAGDDASSVNDGFNVPIVGANGTNFEWTANPAGIIDIDNDTGTATVTRPDTDTAVSLTATVTKGSNSGSKVLIVTVKGTGGSGTGGGNWETVGSSNFSSGSVNQVTMAFDSNDVPYVAYLSGANQDKITVKKWDGGLTFSLRQSNLLQRQEDS